MKEVSLLIAGVGSPESIVQRLESRFRPFFSFVDVPSVDDPVYQEPTLLVRSESELVDLFSAPSNLVYYDEREIAELNRLLESEFQCFGVAYTDEQLLTEFFECLLSVDELLVAVDPDTGEFFTLDDWVSRGGEF